MMNKNQRFVEVTDQGTLGRLSRSQDIATVRQFSGFIAVNLKNGNRYQVSQIGDTLICACPDSANGFTCKHEIGVARDMRLYEGGTP